MTKFVEAICWHKKLATVIAKQHQVVTEKGSNDESYN